MLHPRPVRRDLRGPAGFAAALTGRRFEAARRRGKYLWLPLDNGDALLGHLGMSGQLLVQAPGHPTSATCGSGSSSRPRARWRVRDPARTALRFVDQRMFGGLAVSEGGAELPPEIAHIARDPFDPEFDDDAVRRPGPAAYRRHQAAAARPDPGLRASATSTPTRRCGGPGCTASGRATACARSRCAGCSRGAGRDGRGPRRRAGRASTRSTSTSTASRATSTGRCTPTAARACRASAAVRRSGGSSS